MGSIGCIGLTCQLMLETFTRMELLKVGQRSLVLLEDKMDNISAQIGASETLNVYCDLVLQLRQWVRSYPGNCSALCEETFLPNISSRYRTIDKQLAMSHYSKRGYYNQIRFPYYKSFGESYFCYTICVDFSVIPFDISFNKIGLVTVLLLSALGSVIFKKQIKREKVLAFLIFTLWIYLYSLFVMSLYFLVSLTKYIKLTSYNRSMKLLFYIILYVMLSGALTSTLRKDASMIHFLYLCSLTIDIIKFSSRVKDCIISIFILVFIIDVYIFEIETAHYVSSFTNDLLYPYWSYFLTLRILIACILICLS